MQKCENACVTLMEKKIEQECENVQMDVYIFGGESKPVGKNANGRVTIGGKVKEGVIVCPNSQESK